MRQEYILDFEVLPKEVSVYDRHHKLPNYTDIHQCRNITDTDATSKDFFNFIIILGNPTDETITKLSEQFRPHPIFTWLPENESSLYMQIEPRLFLVWQCFIYVIRG